MKKIIVIWFAILAFNNIANGQLSLYGMTRGNDAKIIKYDVYSNNLTVVHQFPKNTLPWYNNLVQAKDGKLYGLTKSGGSQDYGHLFSFDPLTATYTKLYDFDGQKGRSPYGSLVQATNGKLYGLTEAGGAKDMGTVFSFNIEANSYSKLYDFGGTDGRSPYGSLVQASDGVLYGTTQFGGTNGYGTIFSLDAVSDKITANRHNFNWTDGAWPNSSLVESNNMLYGMTESGGLNYGVVFEFNPATIAVTKVENFTNSNGRSPYGSLVQATNGEFFGMAYRGGLNDLGVLFSINPAILIITKLKDFDRMNGAHPAASLVEARLQNNSPLPLKVLSYNVKVKNRKVELELAVDEEYGIEKYEVQRSQDGINFTPLTYANAKNDRKRTQYTFYDDQPLQTNYYRIKIHELYHAAHFTLVKKVEFGNVEFNVRLTSNPVINNVSILLSVPQREQLSFRLIDVNGRLIKDWNSKTFEPGEHNLELQMSNVEQGTYFLEVKSSRQKRVLKLIK